MRSNASAPEASIIVTRRRIENQEAGTVCRGFHLRLELVRRAEKNRAFDLDQADLRAAFAQQACLVRRVDPARSAGFPVTMLRTSDRLTDATKRITDSATPTTIPTRKPKNTVTTHTMSTVASDHRASRSRPPSRSSGQTVRLPLVEDPEADDHHYAGGGDHGHHADKRTARDHDEQQHERGDDAGCVGSTAGSVGGGENQGVHHRQPAERGRRDAGQSLTEQHAIGLVAGVQSHVDACGRRRPSRDATSAMTNAVVSNCGKRVEMIAITFGSRWNSASNGDCKPEAGAPSSGVAGPPSAAMAQDNAVPNARPTSAQGARVMRRATIHATAAEARPTTSPVSCRLSSASKVHGYAEEPRRMGSGQQW